MAECSNLECFEDEIESIGKQRGKPLLFSQIKREVDGTFKHIQEQRDALMQSMDSFKQHVVKIHVMQRIK